MEKWKSAVFIASDGLSGEGLKKEIDRIASEQNIAEFVKVTTYSIRTIFTVTTSKPEFLEQLKQMPSCRYMYTIPIGSFIRGLDKK